MFENCLFFDRVLERTNTAGTGAFVLAGSRNGYVGFLDVFADGDETVYVVEHETADEWEIGIGTIDDADDGSVSRDTILASSNAGLIVTFSEGAKYIRCTMPSALIEQFAGFALPVADTSALVRDPADSTKRVRIDAGSVGTGHTRVLSMPDRDVDLGLAILSNGSIDFAADQSMGGHKLTDLDDPVDNQDAATKAYVLSVAGAISTDADDITFTPATVGDWTGDTDPGDVADALDQLAERVDDLESTGTDNALQRRDGTTGKTQDCPGWSCSDAGKVTGRATAFPANSATDGATITFDLNAANFFEVTLGGNRTLAISNATVGQNFTMALKQDGTGSRTVTWFDNIYWPGGTTPTLTTTANKVDEFGFRCIGLDGYGDPIFRGHVLGLNFGG